MTYTTKTKQLPKKIKIKEFFNNNYIDIYYVYLEDLGCYVEESEVNNNKLFNIFCFDDELCSFKENEDYEVVE